MKTRNTFLSSFYLIITLSLFILVSCQSKQVTYKGVPFSNSVYKGGAQLIPGTLQCEYFDLGGEGIAYHDSDSLNSGSGALNPADGSYLHEFRIGEAVDISYTKFRDPPVDNSIYNFADPGKDKLYVGWTEPGEWLKYTVDVKTKGTYELGLMYTSNQDGILSFSVNDIDVSGPVLIPSTFVAEDTVDWRQWHHWNYLDPVAEIRLEKGMQTFTIHTLEIGSMNYESIHFRLKDE